MEEDDEAYMRRRRERLDAERASLLGEQAELERRLEAIDRELAAMTAYENVLEGRPAQLGPPAGAERAGERTVGGRAPRGTGAAKREEILRHVRAYDGITTSEINRLMHATDSLPARQSIANALAGLRKEGLIRQAGKRAPYYAAGQASADDDREG